MDFLHIYFVEFHMIIDLLAKKNKDEWKKRKKWQTLVNGDR